MDFGGGVTVHSFTIIDATHLTASISIDAYAALGPRTVNVQTFRQDVVDDSIHEVKTLADGFTVTA